MNFEYEAPDGCWYESPAGYLWIGILGGCGCGSGDLPDLALEVLENFGKEHLDKDRFSVYDKPEYEVLAHWLDNKELIEHGGSVGGSWLTYKGKELLELLKSTQSKDSSHKRRHRG